MALRATTEPMLMRVTRKVIRRERSVARRGMWSVGET